MITQKELAEWNDEPMAESIQGRLKLAANDARAAVIEECAALAASMSGHTHHDIAKRIRALKGQS
jgi:hypothetical protein